MLIKTTFDTSTQTLERLEFSGPTMPGAGKDVEQQELVLLVDGEIGSTALESNLVLPMSVEQMHIAGQQFLP